MMQMLLGQLILILSNHKDYGVYNIHTYSFQDGQATGLNAMTVTVARPEVTTNITQTSMAISPLQLVMCLIALLVF